MNRLKLCTIGVRQSDNFPVEFRSGHLSPPETDLEPPVAKLRKSFIATKIRSRIGAAVFSASFTRETCV